MPARCAARAIACAISARIGVRSAVNVVVQVVEFADLRVPIGEQLRIEVGGDRLHLRRRDAQRSGIHAVAPAPEIVLARRAALGESGDGALEGMAVRVEHPWQHRAGQALRMPGVGAAGPRLDPTAIRAGHQQDIARPAAPDPGQGRDEAAGLNGHTAPARLAAPPRPWRARPAAPSALALPSTPRAGPRACSSSASSPAAPHAHAPAGGHSCA